MINYKIADMAARLNNASILGKSIVEIPYTKDCYAIIKELAYLGYLSIIPNRNASFCHKDRVIKVSLFKTSGPLLETKGSFSPLGPSANIICAESSYGVENRKDEGLRGKFLTVISTPGRRIYLSYKNIKSNQGGFQGYSTYLLRTSKGILNATKAIQNKVGGEVLLKVTYPNMAEGPCGA